MCLIYFWSEFWGTYVSTADTAVLGSLCADSSTGSQSPCARQDQTEQCAAPGARQCMQQAPQGPLLITLDLAPWKYYYGLYLKLKSLTLEIVLRRLDCSGLVTGSAQCLHGRFCENKKELKLIHQVLNNYIFALELKFILVLCFRRGRGQRFLLCRVTGINTISA